MEIAPKIFTAQVMHKRFFPKINNFTYGVYYLALPLSNIQGVAHNKFSILSFYDKDHGAKECSNLSPWIRAILKNHHLETITDEVVLIAMPRVFGYVFNPISFWLCLDKKAQLRAVLCEVNNTFKETHNYLCAHAEGEIIQPDDWLEAKKLFHVSPFLKREGHYKFRFSFKKEKLGIWIDFYNEEGKRQLATSLFGALSPLTKTNLRKVFWHHPLLTLKTIFFIHWQAVRLVAKGVRTIAKPPQRQKKFSRSGNIKKM